MFNGSNCDRKSQLSRILTEPLNPRERSKPEILRLLWDIVVVCLFISVRIVCLFISVRIVCLFISVRICMYRSSSLLDNHFAILKLFETIFYSKHPKN